MKNKKLSCIHKFLNSLNKSIKIKINTFVLEKFVLKSISYG